MPNSAFMKPMQVSDELAEVVGKGPMPRPEVVSKIWDYIRKHKLQNPEDKRMIVADEKLKKVFGGQSTLHMLKLGGVISKHLSVEDF